MKKRFQTLLLFTLFSFCSIAQSVEFHTPEALGDACLQFSFVDRFTGTKTQQSLKPEHYLKAAYCSGYLWGVIHTTASENQACQAREYRMEGREIVSRFNNFIIRNPEVLDYSHSYQLASEFAHHLLKLKCD